MLCLGESAVNLTQVPESNAIKKETSVINLPSSQSKQVPKTEADDKKV